MNFSDTHFLLAVSAVLVILILSLSSNSNSGNIQNEGVVEENNSNDNDVVSKQEPVDLYNKVSGYESSSGYAEFDGTHSKRMNGYISENLKNMDTKLSSGDLLPGESDKDWFETDISVGKNELGQMIPMYNTSNRNSNQQIRGEIPNPQTVVSPFLQTTIVAENRQYDKKLN